MGEEVKKLLWRLFIVFLVFIVGLSFFFYRTGLYKLEFESKGDIPEKTEENVINFQEAFYHIGEEYWVEGEIDHVFVSENNNYFLNFCENYRECPFSAVIFADQKNDFGDIGKWEGSKIYIYGEIETYEKRPQIIINQPDQIKFN